MTEKEDVLAMYRHYKATQHSGWYAVNKTASLLAMDVETVQSIVEEDESND